MLLLRRAPRVLGGGPSEQQYLLEVGCEDSEWCVTRGRRNSGISAATVLVFAAPPRTADPKDQLLSLTN